MIVRLCRLSLALAVVAAPSGALRAQDAAADDADRDAADSAAALAAEPVSYWRDVLPILRARCAGCHQPAKIEGGLCLTTHQSLMAGIDGEDQVVVAGRPDESLLLDVVVGAGDEPPAMPEDGDPLDRTEVELLRRWIAEGARDDTPTAVPPVGPDRPPVYARPPVVTSVEFSPDGALLAVSGFHEVLLHRADGTGLAARLVGLSERIESIAFSPDGRLLAAAGGSPGRSGELQIWDVAERTLRRSVPVTHDCLFGVSFSPDGRLCAFGATDTTVRAVDVETGAQVLYQSAHDDWVLDTVFSTDASHLVTVSRDRSMKLIHVAEQQFIDNITSITPGALKGGLIAVDRHPRDDTLLVGGADGVAKLFRMYREKARKIGDDYNRIRAFDAVPGRIFDVAFDATGQYVVVGSSHRNGGEVRSFRVADGALRWSHPTRGGVFAVAFHPDGDTVAAAGFEGAVELVDAETGWLERQFVPVPIAREGARAAAAVTAKIRRLEED